jgi:hypothetical protein
MTGSAPDDEVTNAPSVTPGVPAEAPNGPWTAAELETLAVVAETFVPGDGVRRARLAADGLSAVADPSQIAQLRLVLRLMESRVANLALAGRASGFSSLDPAARERYLLGWAQSSVPQRRTVYQGLRKLLTFLAYADPGADVPNPRLARIGYDPDSPPVTTELTPVRATPIPAAATPETAGVLDADVVVVGSGGRGRPRRSGSLGHRARGRAPGGRSVDAS